MAETKSPDEPTFPTKRKPDINGEDSHGHQNKAQKLETLEDKSLAPSNEPKHHEASLISNHNVDVLSCNCSSATDEKVEKVQSDVVAEDGGDEGGNPDHGGAEDDGDEDEDGGGEESNGEVVDRKGKGIMRADKGKGKLIEEDDEDDEDSDDDDDSSDDGVVSDGDSDLSDDPLAEVDLNNILPSRTRRRTIHPGEYIANDPGNDDDDESDDSDI
ncbi:secreted acidic protein 1A [Neltuma alba]|uniref:secreted acidic protein 1A n=1 Tax=Neltuma alba TaxID=207710 RepID=UPI0010A3961E|nr:secreted acidic protein 1A [Prosopis alba]